jgi:adenylate kinase family enzyme
MSYDYVNINGTEVRIHLLHKETLDNVIHRVKNKNWDYVCIIAGLPGSGKSTLARTCAKYCCPWFDLTHVAFTADEFIEITNNCAEYSSVILDESFESLNSRTTMTPDFLKVINHLQIIRQKHLFIFLCLPNYFDLAKNVAIFRASHLFVTYPTEKGDRGRFLAFDRDTKRQLFVKGMKYMDYNCIKANYVGDFWKNEGIIDEEAYEGMKVSHLKQQEVDVEAKINRYFDRIGVGGKLKFNHGWNTHEISELLGIGVRTVQENIQKYLKRPENREKAQEYAKTAH